MHEVRATLVPKRASPAWALLYVLVGAAVVGAESAQAQVGAGAENIGINEDASAGLENATPTDSINELNGNGDPNNAGVGGNQGENFDISNTGNGQFSDGGNQAVFDDAPIDIGGDKGNAAGVPSAFGDNGNAGGAKAASGENPTKAPTPLNAPSPAGGNLAPPVVNANVAPPMNPGAPLSPSMNGTGNPLANPATNPAAAAPADAQVLMNQISSEPATAPTNGMVPASEVASGDEAPMPAMPELPEAPPLPPPNEFAGAPPVPGTMRLMAEGEAPEEYTVQPGDTLFDICDQLLDEPSYWPKLWALNPEIKNPHFIFPNMRLRFYPGDDDTPPYLQVVTEDDVIPIDKGDLDEEMLVAEPEKVIFEAEATGIDEGPLTEVVGSDGVEGIAEDFMGGGRLYSADSLQVQVPGFIFREEKEPLAFVIGGNQGEISAGPDRRVLLEASKGVQAGTLYTVLRRGEEVVDFESGDVTGHRYYFIANARVQKKLDDDVYVAAVEGNRLSVMPDDIIVDFLSTSRTIPLGGIGTLSAVNAHVVGFQFAMQEIGGAGNYAFIDKGNGDGVSPGMYVPIFTRPGFMGPEFDNDDLPVDYEMIGVIRIIDTTDAGAVGYVVKNERELRVGDKTRKG